MNMKESIIVYVCLVIVSSLSAIDYGCSGSSSEDTNLFTFKYGNVSSCRSIIKTNHGGLFVAGTMSTSGSTKVLLLELDEDLSEKWHTELSLTMRNDSWLAPSAIQTEDNGYAVVGTHLGGYVNSLIIKIDSNGQLLWKRISRSARETGLSIIENAEGNLLVLSSVYNVLDRTNELKFCLIDSDDGDLLSQDSISLENYLFLDKAYMTNCDNGGGIFVGVEDVHARLNRAFMGKIDSSGTVLWKRVFKVDNSGLYTIHSISKAMDGDYFVLGQSGRNICLSKVTKDGSELWSKIVDIGELKLEIGNAIVTTMNGEILIAGQTIPEAIFRSPDENSDLLVIRTDELGNMINYHTFGGLHFEAGYDITHWTDDQYAIVGRLVFSNGHSQTLIALYRE